MTAIDLLIFAEESQKIPADFLAPSSSTKPEGPWKLLGSHFSDGIIVLFFASLSITLTEHSLGSLMVTENLKHSYSTTISGTFINMLIPCFLYLYFVFWNYMNDGQSPGMLIFGKRMKVRPRVFQDALSTGSYSFLLCVSGGASYFLNKKHRENFVATDHLYLELMALKNQREIKLIDLIAENSEAETSDMPVAA